MDKHCHNFFLGANSKDGFHSLFDRVKLEDPQCKIYAAKGGPGCGKGSTIAAIARAIAAPGEASEALYCTSDPDSLDGIILHGRHLALLDGTHPHVIDPPFPGADGGYIALPPCRDLPALEAKAPALRALAEASQAHYSQATRLIASACRVEESVRAKLLPLVPQGRLISRADGIIGRELPRQSGPGRLRLRFLEGVTPRGLLCRWDTVAAMADRVYAIDDAYGLATPMLERLRDAALARGHLVYACLCPKDPGRLRHVLLPELGLAFVTTGGATAYPGPAYRRVRVGAYLSPEQLRPLRGKVRLLTRIAASLMDDAVSEIAAAHATHDEMEALYRPHLDLAALDRLVEHSVAILKELGQ